MFLDFMIEIVNLFHCSGSDKFYSVLDEQEGHDRVTAEMVNFIGQGIDCSSNPLDG